MNCNIYHVYFFTIKSLPIFSLWHWYGNNILRVHIVELPGSKPIIFSSIITFPDLSETSALLIMTHSRKSAFLYLSDLSPLSFSNPYFS